MITNTMRSDYDDYLDTNRNKDIILLSIYLMSI